MSPRTRTILIWAGIIIALLFVTNLSELRSNLDGNRVELSYSAFLAQVDAGQITEVTIQDRNISGKNTSGVAFTTYAPDDPGLVPGLIAKGVQIVAQPPDSGPSFFGILIQWFPMLLLIAIWVYFFRQMQSGGNRIMGFGRSRARLQGEEAVKVTFADVAGIEESKQELEEIVEFLKDPRKFQRLGGIIPRGVLLIGPPGTGKTLLAKAVAGEAKVPFFIISGSDFVEMFVGVGASRVRDMFEQAKKQSPCIIFIDEIDAVGRQRGAGLGGGNDEREQTLNQLLVEMDGFEPNAGIILIAATNRPDVLDPALLRPGRFDRQVVVPTPDIDGREKILLVHLKKILKHNSINARTIARGTPGFSGADLANLVNEAALIAARFNRRSVTMADLEEAKDKVMMGSERRSMVMTEEERALTAYHEAGHALAAIHSKASDPIHKATIIPRGRALGMVMRLPERDHVSMARDKLEANLVVAMGGRIAEELIYGLEKITTGASQDITMITQIARRMVTEWGMSEKLGRMRYNDNQEEVFLGHSVARQQNVSEATAALIDAEIKNIVDKAEVLCRQIIKKNIKQLHLIAKALLKYETLTGDEIAKVVAGKTIVRRKQKTKDDSNKPRPRSHIPSSDDAATAKKVRGRPSLAEG